MRLLGFVSDAGGGHVDVIVDRDLMSYPKIGAKVWYEEPEVETLPPISWRPCD